MAAGNAFQVHVFRDGRRALQGKALLSGLAGALGALREAARAARAGSGALDDRGRQRALDALLRAGEIECILADAGQDRGGAAARLTDALAEALLGGVVDVLPSDSIDSIDGSESSGCTRFSATTLEFGSFASVNPVTI